MNKSNIPTYKWIIFCILISIISFVIGFYRGEKIYLWIITPFNNAQGEFDYSILWTAIGGIGTIFLSGVTIWQTQRTNQREIIDKNTVRIIANSDLYSSGSFDKTKRPLIYKPSNAANEILVYKQDTIINMLTMYFEYKVFNDCIPDEFFIENPRLLYNNGAGNLLSANVNISGKAVIANKMNPFLICFRIVDDNIDLSNDDFWFFYELTLIKKCAIGSVATSYECINVFHMTQNKDNTLFYDTEIRNILTHQKSSAYLLK
ncbi:MULTISPECIES: hypothetical protein [unclassified Lacrimispora]|uniref:hypothetical protein n=1 Tax=unclassified Lacrimispora TaxID=2719232 RepID=UPI00376F4FC3